MTATSSLVRSLAIAAAMLALGACATLPPEEDPVYQKLSELDGRLLRIERVMANQSLLQLAQQIESVQAEVRTLRGQLEEMEFNLQGTREQQRELYADVDRRLGLLEAGGVAATAGGAGQPAGAGLLVPDGNDRANYQAAFDLLKEGKYPEAAAGFRQFLAAFPESSLADNAQYWLAETHYVTKVYGEALGEFRKVLERFPQSRKIPDALLKIGYCNYELKNWSEARAALNQVREQFPDTTAARLAGQRLAQMDSEGR